MASLLQCPECRKAAENTKHYDRHFKQKARFSGTGNLLKNELESRRDSNSQAQVKLDVFPM